jgi:outer membrane protein OmpA-like peptidoglycan-associated protein/cellobiose-specific phosphotransferase system component IIA
MSTLLKTKFTLLLLIWLHVGAFAQTYWTAETIKGKAKEAYESGLQNIKAGNKEAALLNFEKAAKITPTFINAHLQQAILYQKLSQWEKAEMAFAKVIAIDATYDNRVLYSLVRDALTKQSLSSSLKFIDATTGQIIQTGETDQSGLFLVTLNLGKKYALSVTKQGYSFYSQTFDLSDAAVTLDKPSVIEIDLTPFAVTTNGVTTNRNFVLKNVNFATAQSEPLAESYTELDNLVQMLLQNPTLEVAIHGHTDNVGSANSNLVLSEKRAEAIKMYLISKGIEAKRLSSKGFGATQPTTSNETNAGKAINRRTEFAIVRY